jgi:predicted enzyme related to lactoylglutathione lyase
MSNEEGAVPRWPNWLGLVVEDLEAARRFYGAALDLDPTDAGDDWVQFDMGEHRIFELLRLDPEQVQYAGVRYQPGFEVADIDRARERLLSLGAQQLTDVEGGPEHGGFWCYLRDPQGHVFEISQPVHPEHGAASDPVASPP